MIKFLIKILLNFFDKISQKKVLKVLRNVFKDKINFIIDVGSHHGETIIFLDKYFKYKKIYAFEPSLFNYQILKKKVSTLKKDSKIILSNRGIGIKSEKKILTQLEDLKFPSLDKFLSTKYSSIQKQGFKCNLCNEFTVFTLKGLAAHKRGCSRKLGTQVNIESN